MPDSLATTRLGFFFFAIIIVALFELIAPRRKAISRHRWISHFSLVVVATVCTRLIVPAGAVGAGIYAAENHSGLLYFFEVPLFLKVLAGYIFLEIIIYFQHRLFHSIPLFWKFHRMHHSDIEFDFTTALRFHPFEIIISTFVKILAIMLLGIPIIAIIVFEIVLNASAIFNHGNIYIPPRFEKLLRLFLVTPEMHRIHHSRYSTETDSNFSFSFSIWDRLFGTYTAEAREPQETMDIGINEFRCRDQQRLVKLLVQPFQKVASAVK